MRNSAVQLPLACKDNHVINELPDELLIYDLTTNRALCLNNTARLVLNECDGKTTLAEAVRNLEQRLKTPIDEDVVLIALEQLRRYKLIPEDPDNSRFPKVSRRDLIRTVGALSVALPAITALVAPSPA